MGNRLFVYVDDPKHFEIILNNADSLNKGDSYDFIAESIGFGLITLKCNYMKLNWFIYSFLFQLLYLIYFATIAEQWRFHRKNLNPSFSYNVVNSFYPSFNQNLKILVEKLKPHSNGVPFDLHLNLEACAMDMICGKICKILNKKSIYNFCFHIKRLRLD